MSQKISILDVKEVVDCPLSLLRDVFQGYLSVKHIGYLVTHGKSVRVLKVVICEIIACKYVISND